MPYPLNAYLDAIQYAAWTDAGDTPRLLDELLHAIAGDRPSHGRIAPVGAATAHQAPPPYAAPLPVPGGALDVDDPWYLPRPTDATALSVIHQPGQTLTIKGPRQMGKSSLLMRMIKAGLDVGKKVALLDFQLVDEKTKANADLFFRRFVSSIAEQLELPDTVDELWDDGFSNPQNCTRYVERQILEPLDAPCVLAIDETDCDLPDVVLERFLRHAAELARPARASGAPQLEEAGHRPVHVDRAAVFHRPAARVAVQRRRHSAARGLPARTGPPTECAASAAARPRAMSSGSTRSCGHPYLTRKALYMLAGSSSPSCRVDELFDDAIDDTGPFGDHLRYYLLRLQRRPELIGALRQVIDRRGGGDELLIHRLEAAGLVRRERNHVVPRCDLYARYFRERLHASR